MMTCSGISFTGTITGIPITGSIHTPIIMILGSTILGTTILGTDLTAIITVLITIVITAIPYIPITPIRQHLPDTEELQVILLTAV